MKRLFAYALSFILLFSLLPLNAFAVNQEKNTHDSIITLACEIFPEYSDVILGGPSSISVCSRTQSEREIVRSITREAAEDTMINYTEYSDGIVVLSTYTYSGKKQTVSHTTTSDGYITAVNISVTCTINDAVFYLTNLEYHTVTSGYDSITYKGAPSTSGECSYTYHSENLNETSSANAHISYNVSFKHPDFPTWYHSVSTIVTFTVGDNTAWLTT